MHIWTCIVKVYRSGNEILMHIIPHEVVRYVDGKIVNAVFAFKQLDSIMYKADQFEYV